MFALQSSQLLRQTVSEEALADAQKGRVHCTTTTTSDSDSDDDDHTDDHAQWQWQ